MPDHLARATTGSGRLLAGSHDIETAAVACELLAAALASCCRDSLQPILQRHQAPPLDITVRWPEDASLSAVVRLEPAPADAGLQARLERAILHCPVARRLERAPRIEWQS